MHYQWGWAALNVVASNSCGTLRLHCAKYIKICSKEMGVLLQAWQPSLLMGCAAAEHQDRGFLMATAGPVPSLEGSCTIKEVRICTRFPFREGSFTKGQDLCPQLMMQVLINFFFDVMFATYSECKKKKCCILA